MKESLEQVANNRKLSIGHIFGAEIAIDCKVMRVIFSKECKFEVINFK